MSLAMSGRRQPCFSRHRCHRPRVDPQPLPSASMRPPLPRPLSTLALSCSRRCHLSPSRLNSAHHPFSISGRTADPYQAAPPARVNSHKYRLPLRCRAPRSPSLCSGRLVRRRPGRLSSLPACLRRHPTLYDCIITNHAHTHAEHALSRRLEGLQCTIFKNLAGESSQEGKIRRCPARRARCDAHSVL